MTFNEIDEIATSLRTFLKRGLTEYAYENPYTGELTIYEIPMSPSEEYRIREQLKKLDLWKSKS